MRPRSLAACTLLTLSTLTLGGCLIGSGSSDTVTGTYIGRETLAQMKPGETKEDFVVATLGQPSSKASLSDGSQLWKYNYSRTKRSGAYVFVLLTAGSKEQTVATTFVELKDGVVSRAWQDVSAPSEATTVKTSSSPEPK
ncbi:MAG: outer membrane protein assembly factor BamE domain-containing protein [Phycisphaerales bacterium]